MFICIWMLHALYVVDGNMDGYGIVKRWLRPLKWTQDPQWLTCILYDVMEERFDQKWEENRTFPSESDTVDWPMVGVVDRELPEIGTPTQNFDRRMLGRSSVDWAVFRLLSGFSTAGCSIDGRLTEHYPELLSGFSTEGTLVALRSTEGPLLINGQWASINQRFRCTMSSLMQINLEACKLPTRCRSSTCVLT